MKTFGMILATVFGLALTTGATAADNKKLLLGKWEVVKADEMTVPVGTTIEFLDTGKMKLAIKDGPTFDATYTVDGDTFTIKLENMDLKITIKKLTETELDTANPQGKAVSFKKAK